MDRRQLFAGFAGVAATLGSVPAVARDENGSISVPIAVTKDRRIVTSLTIGGSGPYYFIIDTGAYVSGIKPSLARKLKLRYVAHRRSKGIGGGAYSKIYEGQDVVFGEAFRLKAMAMSGLEIFEKSEYDGLLAAGFLTGVPSRLDFERNQITFYPSGLGIDLQGYHVWPSRREMEGAGEKVYVDVVVDGLKATCLLDTGATPALSLYSSFVHRHKLWKRYANHEDRVARGLHGGQVKTRFVHAGSLDIGGFPIGGAPVTLYDPSAAAGLGGEDGIVGMGAIGRFNHAFTPDALYVKPNRFFDDVLPLFTKGS